MAKKRGFSPALLLKIVLGAYFIVFGITGIIGKGSELSKSFKSAGGDANSIIVLIMAVLVLLAGIVILVSFFTPIKDKIFFVAVLVIMAVWIFKIVSIQILDVNFDFFNQKRWLEWSQVLAGDLVILASLWSISKE